MGCSLSPPVQTASNKACRCCSPPPHRRLHSDHALQNTGGHTVLHCSGGQTVQCGKHSSIGTLPLITCTCQSGLAITHVTHHSTATSVRLGICSIEPTRFVYRWSAGGGEVFTALTEKPVASLWCVGVGANPIQGRPHAVQPSSAPPQEQKQLPHCFISCRHCNAVCVLAVQCKSQSFTTRN